MHSDIERQQQTAERLRTLSVDSQPPYEWLEFRRRAQIRAGARVGAAREHAFDAGRGGLRYAAAAAALLVVTGSIALWGRTHGSHVAARPTPEVESPSADADARTQVAERWLASLPQEPVIVRFGTRVAVNKLEDQIAQVDDMLTAANFDAMQTDHVAALQQERNRLIGSLAQVRYAETLAAESP